MAEKRKSDDDSNITNSSKKLKISNSTLNTIIFNRKDSEKLPKLGKILEEYDIIEWSEVEIIENSSSEKLDNDLKEKKEIKNLCIGCGRDMGDDNPRQYCRKTYCEYDE